MTTGFPGANDGAAREILSVGQLNRAVAGLLERSFPLVWVSGEISGMTRAASGHWYFSLKDSQASVRAVMFRGRNQHVDFAPREGDLVEVRAQVGLYEARGEFQLGVEQMRRAGAGDLYQQFMRLKARLEQQGLFDPARKRPLPAAPRAIGVVTSPRAAALRDVLSTLARRAPHIPVIVYPAAVQGAQAPAELVRALRAAGQRRDCDVLLLVRGGGAIEDLWAFNDEALARAVADCPLPVVSGVGHETDFTIADFVADVRAPTPTGAAMRVAPDRRDQLASLAGQRQRLVQAWRHRIEQRAQRLDHATRLLRPPSLQWAQRASRLGQLARQLAGGLDRLARQRAQGLSTLAARMRLPDLAARSARIDATHRALAAAARARLEGAAQRLAGAGAGLELVSPRAVLERGYAIVRAADGAIVREASVLGAGAAVSVLLARGEFDATVTRVAPAVAVSSRAPADPKSVSGTGPD